MTVLIIKSFIFAQIGSNSIPILLKAVESCLIDHFEEFSSSPSSAPEAFL
jgi:hypothetical protein